MASLDQRGNSSLAVIEQFLNKLLLLNLCLNNLVVS